MVRFLCFLFILSSSTVFADSPVTKFENASIRDKDFLAHAFDAGKTYLKEGEFGKTLAITQYYRSNYLKNEKAQRQFFQESFFQLEVLTLSRLCQWKHTSNLMKEYETHLTLLNKSKDKFIELEKQIAQAQILQDTLKEKAETQLQVTPDFKKLVLYKVDHSILSHASHPKYFTIKIKNKCEKRY